MINDFDFQQYINDKLIEVLPASFKREGDKMHGRCPLCGDSKKSSTKKRGWYYFKSGMYFCFNCSASMSGLKLLSTLTGQSISDIKKDYYNQLAKSGKLGGMQNFVKIDIQPKFNLLNLKPVIKPEIKLPLSDKAKDYLNKRLVLSAPFLKENFYSVNLKRGEYILIPWVLNGIDAFFQINDFQKLTNIKYSFPKKIDKLIYGLDNVDISWPYLFLFEGVYDSLFVKNGLAIGGKHLTDLQKEILKKRYPNHKLVYSFDNDQAGYFAMKKMLSKDSLFFNWFSDYKDQKDINECVLLKNDVNIFADKSYLESRIESAINIDLFLLNKGITTQETRLSNDNSSQRWKIPGNIREILSNKP